MKRIVKATSFFLILLMLITTLSASLTASAASSSWTGSWGTPAIDSGINLAGTQFKDVIPANSTLRTVVTPTLGGTKVRLKFSNLFGKKAVTINETTIAKTAASDDLVDPNTITQITFNRGQKAVTIAAGSEVYSDEIEFKTTALEKVSISTYYKSTTTMFTIGLYGATTYLCSTLGNKTHSADVSTVATKLDFTSNTITYNTIPFFTRLDVYAENSYCVVVFGDSTVTNEIPQMLSEKLGKNGITNVGFIMSGIIGNKLLSDGTGLLGTVYGQSGLERAKRDAFNVAGVKYVLVKIGINDVIHPMLKSNEGMAPVYADQVIDGYKQLAKQAKNTGIKLYLCTRTPYKGYTRNFMGSDDLEWTQAGEDILLEINKWVKSQAVNYGYAGFMSADKMRDTNDSAKLRDHMTTDGAHFSKTGQIAFTDLIPEEVYGVNRELKNYSTILNVDPYKAPPKQETTTTAGSSGGSNLGSTIGGLVGNLINGNSGGSNNNEATTANNNNNNNSSSTQKPADIQPITDSSQTPQIIAPPAADSGTQQQTNQQEAATSNANQILLDEPNNQNIGAVTDDDGKSAAKQMAGFAILATVAIAIIAVAAVMLVHTSPIRSAPLARGGFGRANRKKRV